MELYMGVAITTLVGSGAGSFLGAYLKKKGENLATHEDIDQLVDQVRAVTTTTKEIEAKISNDVWDRQKRWELKRDVLFEAARRLSDMEDALLSLDSVMQIERAKLAQGAESGWREEKVERIEFAFRHALPQRRQHFSAFVLRRSILSIRRHSIEQKHEPRETLHSGIKVVRRVE